MSALACCLTAHRTLAYCRTKHTLNILPGLPVVVARRMMQNTAGLIGRTVTNAAEAARAAADGASIVLLEVSSRTLVRVV